MRRAIFRGLRHMIFWRCCLDNETSKQYASFRQCTEAYDTERKGVCEPRSKRTHDLIDLQVIVAHGKVDWEKVRNICVRLFAYRRQLSWPPTVEVREGWESLYLEQATGLDVIQNVDEAVKWANELIVTIEETVSYRGANI